MKITQLVQFSVLGSLLMFGLQAQAQVGGPVNVSVSDVTNQFNSPSPTPIPDPGLGGILPTDPGGTIGSGCNPLDPWCNPYDPGWGYGSGKFDLNTVLTLGQKVWDFIREGKPTADYQTLKGAVLPGGATNWSQLKGWRRPVAKIYKVEFKTNRGKVVGGFGYRVTFIYGGGFQGKGKYIGQIAVAPFDIKLKTDQHLNVRAELLDALNFGTEDDPVAGVQLQIRWNNSTTFRYNMNSIEYFLYGTGEVQDISNGTLQAQ